MTFKIADRIQETCYQPGTGTVSLLGAAVGFQTFASAIGNGNTTFYVIADQYGSNWEVGVGTYNTSGNTLARNTIISSSNSNTIVNFSSGTQNVWCDYPSENAIYIDASGNTYAPNLGATTASTGKFTALTNTALTSGRVTYAGTGGLLQDSANFVFDGTNVGIGTSSPSAKLQVSAGNILLSNAYSLSARNAANTLSLSLIQRNASDQVVIDSDGYGTLIGSGGALNLNSSGNLGLGVTPSAWFSSRKAIQIGSTYTSAITGVSDGTTEIWSNSYLNTSGNSIYVSNGYATLFQANKGGAGNFAWLQAPSGTAGNAITFTQAMTLDASNRLLIGTTSASGSNYLQVNSDASINGLTVGKGGGSIGSNTVVGNGLSSNSSGVRNSSFGYNNLFNNTTGTDNSAYGNGALYTNTTGTANTALGEGTLQNNTTASNNTAVGYQAGYSATTGYGNTFVGSFAGYNVTTGNKNTVIGQYNGNQGGLDIRTSSNYIVLSDGDGNPRGIFDGSGNFLVGPTSTAVTQSGFSFVQNAGASTANVWHASGTASGNAYAGFYYNTSLIGSITQSGTTGVLYNITSDRRLKSNIAPLTDSGTIIDALLPRTFTWNADGSKAMGFITDEYQQVFPNAITGEKDAVDAEGKPVYQQGDFSTSEFMAVLVAEIQSLRARLKAANIA